MANKQLFQAMRGEFTAPAADRNREGALAYRYSPKHLLAQYAVTGAPLKWLNARDVQADLVIFVSDNQSWVDARKAGPTEMMRQWGTFKAHNSAAKLVCIDIQPQGTTQAMERADVLNVGGFSDEVFEVVNAFAADALAPGHWVQKIEEVLI